MKILVIGAGAVGGYFGGRLVQANRDVTFLVHRKRAETIKANGLQIISTHGNVTLHPKAILADEINQPYDLILLGVKNYALSAAVNDFAAAVGPDTMILPFQNGMSHIDLLIERFGKRAVLGGVCLVMMRTTPRCTTRSRLGDRTKPSVTKLSDLAVLCANCHVMAHVGNQVRSLESLLVK